jgi:Flp pilus assembly protein TadD
MDLQEQYDEAMFEFSRGDFAAAAAQLRAVLAADPQHFEARLALGMALYRQGDYAGAIAEGHRAEQLRPREQLVHTNLSLFYLKAGDKAKAEHHGLQARIASWREDAARPGGSPADPELALARPPAANAPAPAQFPDMPWKRKT